MDIKTALSHATETKVFEVGINALKRLPEIVARLGIAERAVIVADENTYAAAGEKVEHILREAAVGLDETILYPGQPVLHAEYGHVVKLRERLRTAQALPIAVGSGTINDLVKRSVWELGRRYVSVGTAVSMDGYTSAGAAIVKDGFKQTLECSAPIGIVGDLDVLAAAPAMMTAAGYGDLFAKIVAGADWILADELGVESIDPLAWRMVQEELREWLGRPSACAAGDREAIAQLYTGLSLTGFAMQAIHKSRPASGAEHQLSHIWEMENLTLNGLPVSHGLKVAIGSLASCAIFELLLALDLESIDVERRVGEWPSWQEREAEISALAGDAPYTAQMKVESKKKHLTPEALRSRLLRLNERWDVVRKRLEQQLYPYGEMRAMMEAAGCHVRPEELGLSRERAVRTIRLAQMMRERYTVLDIAYELGLLDEWAEQIFSSVTYWR